MPSWSSSRSRRRNPFSGSLAPSRIPLVSFGSRRPTLPFPHPWNYQQPLRILEAYFWNAEAETGPGRHSRYLDVPGFKPILVTRDPRLIRAISAMTSDQPGHFDRDTLPSTGIARATGEDTLLYANGPSWKQQKKIAMPPFARTTLFQPERFDEFESLFRKSVEARLGVVRRQVERRGGPLRAALEPEIKALMLEMLVNCFFGASVAYEEIRGRYVPALERVIDHIVRDTVLARFGLPLHRLPPLTRGMRSAREARAIFEELTSLVIAQRGEGSGLWSRFQSEATDEALRGNIRVFLAGALEATTSYASWAIAHLARHRNVQEKLYREIKDIDDYTPGTLAQARYLGFVLDETLRLTPSLYFHPRRATADTVIETATGDTLRIPKGTHILLDVWHANRHEDHWGIAATGYRASDFVPERWERLESEERGDLLHFGFGHGPRFCPGKSLGQLEVALVVGACVKLFEFEAVQPENHARAGVSTKPVDGVLVNLRLRNQPAPTASTSDAEGGKADDPVQSQDLPRQHSAGCPFTSSRPAT